MKQTLSHRFSATRLIRWYAFVAASSLIALQLLLAYTASAAGTATLSLSPASGSYQPGNTVTVTVVINSNGNNVNTTQANFTYPTSLLQYQSFDYGTTDFSIQAESSASGGTVRMARGNITPLNGTSLVVGKVKFTVLSSTGTATLNFTAESTVVSSDTSTNILGAKNGASYTISQPAPTPAPTTPTPTTPPPITSPSTTTPKTTTTKTPSTTATAPTTTSSPSTPTSSNTPVTNPEPTTSSAPPATDAGGTESAEKSTNAPSKYVAYTVGVLAIAVVVVGAWRIVSRRLHVAPVAMPSEAGTVVTSMSPTNATPPPAQASGPVASHEAPHDQNSSVVVSSEEPDKK